ERNGGGIYVIPSLSGREAVKIAEAGRQPRFSPDGRWIAYWTGNVSDTALFGTSQIYIVASTGGAAPRQLQPEFAATRYPVWSRDGKHILFLGARSPERSSTGVLQNGDWWVTSIDGGPATPTGAIAVLRKAGIQGLTPGDW